MIIGIEGKSGTGKSHIIKYLKRKLRFPVIKEQNVIFELIEDIEQLKSEITKRLGPKILHPNNKIKRDKFKLLKYKDQPTHSYLNTLLNPLVGKYIRDYIKKNEDNYIIEVINPDKLKITNLFNISVLVTSAKDITEKRLGRKYPKWAVTNMIKLERNSKSSDFIIQNNGSIQELKSDVEQLIKEMFNKP